MKVVNDEEMRESLNRHDGLRCEGRQLRFDHPEAKSIIVDLRVSEPHQLVYLARLAAHLRYEEGLRGRVALDNELGRVERSG
jgi:hypothetical protein